MKCCIIKKSAFWRIARNGSGSLHLIVQHILAKIAQALVSLERSYARLLFF